MYAGQIGIDVVVATGLVLVLVAVIVVMRVAGRW